MDGSYGNGLPSGMVPRAPGIPHPSTDAKYQTNVNRSKTRKWVEAKSQNYDGDDWGADYGEPEEEDEPPLPPPKPMGPRQPSGLPSTFIQPPPSQSAAGAASNLTSPSNNHPALRVQTQAQPPQTSPSTTPKVGQADPGSPWVAYRPPQSGVRSFTPPTDSAASVQSPQVPQSAATASSVYSSDHPGYGFPTQPATTQTQRTASPAPGSAGSLPSRVPVSSQQPDSVDPAPPATSSQKPWAEARPASPGVAKSPTLPTKALPFIRPADIYKRMEEEREKERRSIDSSAGRPSLDSLGGRSGGGVASPTVEPSRLADPVDTAKRNSWRPSMAPEESIDVRQPSRTGLPTVAERKSEYGLEGLIASYGPDEGDEVPPAPAASLAYEQPPAPVPPAPASLEKKLPIVSAPEPEPEATLDSPDQEEMRRFSSSPKLPDLARMSVFGDDFFSSASSSFLADAPPLPTIPELPSVSKAPKPVSPTWDTAPALVGKHELPGTAAEPKIESPLKSAAESGTSAPSFVIESIPTHAAPHVSSDGAKDAAAGEQRLGAKSPSLVEQIEPDRRSASQSPARSGSPMQLSASDPAEKQRPVSGTSQLTTTRTEESEVALRPSSYVEGTAWNTTSLPNYNAPEAPTLLTGHETFGTDGSGVKKDKISQEPGSLSADTQAAEVAAEARGVEREREVDTKVTSGSVHPASRSPLALPPIRTSSPSSPTSSQLTSTRLPPSTEDAMPPPPPPKDSAENDAATLRSSTTSTGASSIPPTAPLNPRMSVYLPGDSHEEFVPPPSLERASTIDTNSSSPVKESDVLREEIIRSLSPVQGPPLPTTESTLAVQEPAGASGVRESSYLGDFYGDYWGSTDAKAEEDARTETGQEDRDKTPEPSTQPVRAPEPEPAPLATPKAAPPAESQAVPQAAPQVPFQHPLPSQQQPIPIPQPQSAREVSPGRRRFSWEFDGDEEVEPKALSTDVGLGIPPNSGAPPTPPTQIKAEGEVAGQEASGTMPTIAAPEETQPGPEDAPAIRHQISAASTLPPTSGSPGPIELPSPVSNLSERTSEAAAVRGPSLADEKGLVRESSIVVSPSPPRETHPALLSGAVEPATSRPGTTTSTAAATARPTASGPAASAIIPFRQILGMQLPVDRIKHYKETRDQFASMDTGLDNWLADLRARHPEHANAGPSFQTGFPRMESIKETPKSARRASQLLMMHQNSPGQQNPSASPGGATAGPSTQLHSGATFSHTSKEVGVKSKVFLMAAGKAGKGLLSKGKNKLRNTGDKVFSQS